MELVYVSIERMNEIRTNPSIWFDLFSACMSAVCVPQYRNNNINTNEL